MRERVRSVEASALGGEEAIAICSGVEGGEGMEKTQSYDEIVRGVWGVERL